MVAVNPYCYERNTCHRQSMCQQTVLRFHISLRETFLQLSFNQNEEKYDKSAVDQI